MKITAIEPFVCDGGLREFGFLKVSTDEGIIGLGRDLRLAHLGLAGDRAAGHGPDASSARTRDGSSS